MSDWENSDSDTPAAKVTAPIPAAIPPKKNKWEGEDEDDDNVASDWEESSDEEEAKPAPVAAPPAKKKGSVKAKIAEKEAQKAARAAAGDDDDVYDEDDVLDPREKARRDRERELNADLANAIDLLSGASVNGGGGKSELDKLVSANPKTKEEFQEYSKNLVELLIKKHQHKPLYASFVEAHVRELAQPLKDVEVRKAASGLTTLANEKQREARDKVSGKKKPKAANKPTLGSVKKHDTTAYEESLDDFGNNADDFM